MKKNGKAHANGSVAVKPSGNTIAEAREWYAGFLAALTPKGLEEELDLLKDAYRRIESENEVEVAYG